MKDKLLINLKRKCRLLFWIYVRMCRIRASHRQEANTQQETYLFLFLNFKC